ncbi:Nitrogenase component 1 type Oxidoreductase [Anaerocolumna xylanovorans DSM 12503]|uniref:Nitrogenase component 1 type Oxidoreductase n=1 Tax=Anaerocolumna xylanovorans DSM 12503 TaxID=1121345 RepID=A0A1M7XWY8_9FIRM|nr:Nitrogenase component 1 type Oxidoreductase [Anaerocolumna xylanovorans DSM 12503]
MSKTYSGIRESRPYTYNDCGGNSRELSSEFGKRCLKAADRTFSQGLQCQQINSMAALMSLDDAVFVAHSPQGCVGCTSMASDMYRVGQAHRGVHYIKSARIIVTNLDQKDVILGGEAKLREAVKLARERYQPKIIFIFTSCASGIIGDDIDAVARDLQEESEALIIPVHCDGFKSKICASGFDAAFLAIS